MNYYPSSLLRINTLDRAILLVAFASYIGIFPTASSVLRPEIHGYAHEMTYAVPFI